MKYAMGDEFPESASYQRELSLDRAFLAHDFKVAPALSTEDLVRSFMEQAAGRTSKPLISANVHSRFDLLKRLWPNARFIHLLRDPRDVARSCIGMGWVGNVYYGADYWLDAEQRWDLVSRALDPADFIEIRYEALVTNPESTLSAVCRFLELPYDPQMLEFHAVSTYEPIDERLANQWKRKMSRSQIGLVEAKCNLLMQARGYAPVTGARTPSFIQQCGLLAHDRFARRIFNVRRYGISLYLQWQLAKRLPSHVGWARRTIMKKGMVDQRHLK